MLRPISSSQQHKRLGRINTRRKAERNEGGSSEEPSQPGRRGSEQRQTGFGDTTQLVGSETGRAHLLRSQRTSRPEGVAMDTYKATAFTRNPMNETTTFADRENDGIHLLFANEHSLAQSADVSTSETPLPHSAANFSTSLSSTQPQ